MCWGGPVRNWGARTSSILKHFRGDQSKKPPCICQFLPLYGIHHLIQNLSELHKGEDGLGGVNAVLVGLRPCSGGNSR